MGYGYPDAWGEGADRPDGTGDDDLQPAPARGQQVIGGTDGGLVCQPLGGWGWRGALWNEYLSIAQANIRVKERCLGKRIGTPLGNELGL